jgi:hypothetical protein
MEEILKCKICKNAYNNEERSAYIIKCGHTFCRICIISKYDDTQCPLCGITISFRIEICIQNKIIEEINNLIYNLGIL